MAVIKYGTSDGPVEYRVDAENISYEDETGHWRIKVGQQDGRDVYELIPRERVYSVKVVGNETGTLVTRMKSK